MKVQMLPSRFFILLVVLSSLGGITWWLWPSDPSKIFQRGITAVATNDWDTVKDCRDQLSEEGDWASHRSLLSGHLLKSQNRLDLAFVVFSKANSHVDTRVDAYFQAGSIRYAQRRFSECIALFRQVLEWDPDHLPAHQLLAAASYDIGAMEQAVVSLDEVIRLTERPDRAAYMKASILFDFERFADSVQAFDIALRHVAPQSDLADEIRSGAAAALIRLRRFEEVLKVLKPAKALATVLVQRATANYSLNQLDAAQQQLNKAIEREPGNPEAAALLAQILEKQDRRIDGIAILQEALKLHPLHLPIHHRMADLLAAEGRTEEALHFRSEADRIAKLRSDFSHAQQDLIRDQRDPHLRLKVAELAEQLNRFEDANTWHMAAIGLAPSDPTVAAAYTKFLDRHPEFGRVAETSESQASDQEQGSDGF